jgi:hypothetical protein
VLLLFFFLEEALQVEAHAEKVYGTVRGAENDEQDAFRDLLRSGQRRSHVSAIFFLFKRLQIPARFVLQNDTRLKSAM